MECSSVSRENENEAEDHGTKMPQRSLSCRREDTATIISSEIAAAWIRLTSTGLTRFFFFFFLTREHANKIPFPNAYTKSVKFASESAADLRFRFLQKRHLRFVRESEVLNGGSPPRVLRTRVIDRSSSCRFFDRHHETTNDAGFLDSLVQRQDKLKFVALRHVLLSVDNERGRLSPSASLSFSLILFLVPECCRNET